MKNDPRHVYPGTQFYGAIQPPAGLRADPMQDPPAVGMNYGYIVPPGGMTHPVSSTSSTGFVQPMSMPHTTLSSLFT